MWIVDFLFTYLSLLYLFRIIISYHYVVVYDVEVGLLCYKDISFLWCKFVFFFILVCSSIFKVYNVQNQNIVLFVFTSLERYLNGLQAYYIQLYFIEL